MKSVLLVSAYCVCSLFLNAQEGNLVPNPSFEEYIDCPQGTAGFQTQVIDWFSWQESPDFFHVCNNDGLGTAGVPNNALGSQESISGEGYAGLFTFADPFENIREYIATELLEPLVTGEEYYIMFYVSPHDGGSIEDRLCYSNNIGLRFFKDPEYGTWDPFNPLTPDNFAHLNTVEINDSTEEWTLIEGWFTADDNYNWVCIGNFFDDNNTQTLEDNENSLCWTFFYIENVCVATSPDECEYLLSTEDKSDLSSIQIYPNPSSSVVQFAGFRGLLDLEVFSTDGRRVFSQRQLSQNSQINIESLSNGAYIAVLSNDSHRSEHILIKK